MPTTISVLDGTGATQTVNTLPGLGQALMAASLPVVLASDQSSVTVAGTVTANIGTSGSLALDATLTGGSQRAKVTDGTNNAAVKAASTAAAATDPALVVAVSPNNSVAVTGTFWQATQPVSGTITANQGGTWTVQPGNTANTTPWLMKPHDGTTAGTIKAASTAAAFTDTALVVDARPGGALVTASAALADALANPTLGVQSQCNYLFNGSTWDRTRGMSGSLTTGDTGAKTATGNGATQTNVGNSGVQILLVLGTVSGTSPTLVLKVQGSVDGGTTFYDIPGATTASLTATGNFGITIYPGIATTAGTTTSGTTATASQILPRNWRVVWTIGGTTPSFTITSVQYNYLVN